MPGAFTITDLKKQLGPGLGLRKNKYLLEIPIPGVAGSKTNVLARSAGLPERTISTATLHHKGRIYNVRGETNYAGSYEVSIVDDSSMLMRRKFDAWLKLVDDSKPAGTGLSGGSYETSIQDALGIMGGVTNAVNNPAGTAGQFLIDSANVGLTSPTATYQTDINVWQLSNTSGKVYGYKLQNAFPAQLGVVTLDDDNPNTLSEFSVTFAFSEFVTLDGGSIPQAVLSALTSGSVNQTLNTLGVI